MKLKVFQVIWYNLHAVYAPINGKPHPPTCISGGDLSNQICTIPQICGIAYLTNPLQYPMFSPPTTLETSKLLCLSVAGCIFDMVKTIVPLCPIEVHPHVGIKLPLSCTLCNKIYLVVHLYLLSVIL